MDINTKEENILSEDQGKIELKEISNDDNNKNINNNSDNDNNTNSDIYNKENTEIEEIPQEVLMYRNKQKEENKTIKTNYTKKPSLIDEDSDAGEPIGKKVMKTLLLNLNSYWLEILGTISLIIYIFIYELVILLTSGLIISSFNKKLNIDMISNFFEAIFVEIGLKWYVFIEISQHLSVGFFCLTTFSKVFHETKNIKKFYIINSIKVVIFYAFTVIILKVVIKDALGNFLKDLIDEYIKDKGADEVIVNKSYEICDILINKFLILVSNLIATYNIFLEKFVLGSLYIFLLCEPKNFLGKKLLYFRFLSLIPISFMIVSIILRALQNSEIISINEYVSPLLLGPKITIYGFFISTILMIKYKSIKYEVFDEENYIEPKVFTKIGSRMYSIFGILELIIGLLFPSWNVSGIGGKYLLILCAPIITLYDYKKKYEVHLPCCKKRDFSICFKIIIYVFGYGIIIIFGMVAIIEIIGIVYIIVKPVVEFIINNIDIILELIKKIL